MRNFPAELLPKNNEGYSEGQRAAAWAARTYNNLLQQLENAVVYDVTNFSARPYSEYRLALEVDHGFERRRAYYRHLEWRFMADGWNAARAVTNGSSVLLRLFALLEPLLVEVEGIDPFPVEIPVPYGWDDNPQEFTPEAHARSVAEHGAWRYQLGEREFIPPHRIIRIHQRFSFAEP